MKIKDIINCLSELAPLDYTEDFDNAGLLVGNQNEEVNGILVTLDTLEEVIDEAIDKNCNLIVSFHPIIFKGLKKLTGVNYVERTVLKAIKNNIAIFAIHTALDNAFQGVNSIICDQLGLQNKKILIPQKETIKKITTYVPEKDAEKVRDALFSVGAGSLGNYDNCSFSSDGIGTYKGNENSNPKVGERGQLETQKEVGLQITFKKHLKSKVLNTLFNVHPYEEVAYELSALENTNQHIGMGMVGELEKPMDAIEFLEFVKKTMNASVIKHSAIHKNEVKKIAVLGGSGSFAISAAKRSSADVFITADMKYHDFFSAEKKIILADIGHYESEQFTKNFLVDYLSKKITNFAPAFSTTKVYLSDTNTNPVKYL